MFGSKARKIQRLETVLKGEGEYLETARLISESVQRLMHEEPAEYDKLLDAALDSAAKQEALRLEAQRQPQQILRMAPQREAAPDVGPSSAAPSNELRLKVALGAGQTLTGAYIAVMGSIFTMIEAFSSHDGVSLGRLAVDGAVTFGGAYMSRRGFKQLEPAAT